ncbi:MAG: DUF6484 domain-containing protein [Nitrospira sp.]|nr:DUF6484 domain-containing protein [Nitrospira sp.]MDH4243242.1 DUF6484 domain-containing protein [Nitrospira sp.]MDH4356010.1 DUF6484 domain-containing protein [Nitrospira sp.]MDH5317413.1 DUF6484 domain-containing protein [Nitrospira sp.]
METVKNQFEVLVEDREASVLDVLTASPVVLQPEQREGVGALTARFEGFDSMNRPILSGLSSNYEGVIPARTTMSLEGVEIGAGVVVLCEQNDVQRPIIIGVLQDEQPNAGSVERQSHPLSVQVDDQRHVISAEREIVLRCGDASITLTRAGKILIKGTYVVSRSSGVNHVKGGSVQIN